MPIDKFSMDRTTDFHNGSKPSLGLRGVHDETFKSVYSVIEPFPSYGRTYILTHPHTLSFIKIEDIFV